MIPPAEAFKTRHDLSTKMQENIFSAYSLRKVFLQGAAVGALERDIHRSIQREKGLDAAGILIPFEVFARDLSIAGGSATGGALVQTTVEKTVAVPTLRWPIAERGLSQIWSEILLGRDVGRARPTDGRRARTLPQLRAARPSARWSRARAG